MSGAVATPAQGGEEETGMAVGDPVTAQALQGRFRQRHEAVFGALTAVDMDHFALAVDIGDLQMLGFLQSQTAGVDGGEEGAVMRTQPRMARTSSRDNTAGRRRSLCARTKSSVCQSRFKTWRKKKRIPQ